MKKNLVKNKKRIPRRGFGNIYVGMKYKNMTVLSLDDTSGGNGRHYRWNLLCDCGQLHNVGSRTISKNNNIKCSCSRNFENLVGRTVGNIIVCGFAGYDIRHRRKKPQWFYQCQKCGIVKISTSEVLKRGDIKTCGHAGCRPSGEESPKYKLNAVNREKRSDGRRRVWCRSIFERDNFVCIACGEKTNKIQAHHLNGWHWDIKGRFDINNGVTLCKDKLSGCHYNFHKQYGSENNTREQFAEYLKKYHNKNLNDIITDFKLEYSP